MGLLQPHGRRARTDGQRALSTPVRTLDDLEVEGRRVLVRLDLNVPLNGDVVSDDTRIVASLPTLRELRRRDATLVLMSHLGRPRGEAEERFRLRPVAKRLSELLGTDVRYLATPGPASAEQQRFVAEGPPGSVTLLENTRFDSRETANDPALARTLAGYADLHVNDAFGAAHRAHASTRAVAELLPSAAGLLMMTELEALSRLTDGPTRPFKVVLGGAKVSDKLAVIEALLERLLKEGDALLIGGAMAYTFIKAGVGEVEAGEVGDSLVEDDMLSVARKVALRADERGIKLLLPRDSVCAKALEEGVATEIHPSNAIPAGLMGLDIGPAAITEFVAELQDAATVFWNGPLGVFEIPAFAAGTMSVAKAIAGLDAYTVVGGGDSLAAVNRAGVGQQIDHLSTGGGASLEFLEGQELPGVSILRR